MTIRLSEEGENTRLVLTHDRLSSPDYQQGASAGWHAHLDLLSDLMEDRPTRDFWIHFASVKSHYSEHSK